MSVFVGGVTLGRGNGRTVGGATEGRPVRQDVMDFKKNKDLSHDGCNL